MWDCFSVKTVASRKLYRKRRKKTLNTSMHWAREEEWRTDLPQKTEGETPTGKAQKLLAPKIGVRKGRVQRPEDKNGTRTVSEKL